MSSTCSPKMPLMCQLTKWMYLLFFASAVLLACNKTEQAQADQAGHNHAPKEAVEIDENDIEGSVVALIDNNEFERAFTFLAKKDAKDPTVQLALQRVHLNYGLGLMNMTVSSMTQGQRPQGGMASNMHEALRQFLKAHALNPENEAAGIAKQQIQSIMSVYATMPDRLDSIPSGIRDSLRVIGYDL